MRYSLLFHDEPDTADLRDRLRQAHRDYLTTFATQIVFAGPFATDDASINLGSLRAIDLPDADAVDRHIAGDPFVAGGVWKRWTVHVWQSSRPWSWRDCPRGDGNVQMLFHALYRPGIASLHKQHRPAHLDFLDAHPDAFIGRGPLFDATGQERVGSLLLLDVPTMTAGHALMADEPYNKAGIYRDVTFRRWRFGEAFDRFAGPASPGIAAGPR